MQAELPIWVGGSGEKRTLRIAARYADGWNVPFVSPETVAHKRNVLADHCATVGRDPAEIRTAVNVGLCPDDDALQAQFGGLAEGVRPGVLMGSPDQLVDRIGEYVDAGADQINIAMRAPWQLDLLDLATEAIGQLRTAVTVRAWAPGRVNLIGDHTDHTGGLVLPMAIDLGTTVTGERGGDAVDRCAPRRERRAGGRCRSTSRTRPRSSPGWARYVAGVVAELRPTAGFAGEVDHTLPDRRGPVVVRRARGGGRAGARLRAARRSTLAQLCQRAEQRASGVPCGIMDQLTSAAGVEGHALRIDCTSLDGRARCRSPTTSRSWWSTPVERAAAGDERLRRAGRRVPGRRRPRSARSPRRRSPTSSASTTTWCAAEPATSSPRTSGSTRSRRRSRAGDRAALREAMAESHASLRDDFEVSTPALDALVDALVATDGVIGARLTGAGFGGCVVALVERGTTVSTPQPRCGGSRASRRRSTVRAPS